MPLSFEHTLVEALPRLAAPVSPRAWPEPELVLLNEALAVELGLDPDELREHGAAWFGGGELPDQVQPVALAYSGHQFGHFSGLLGDGRAALLGERTTTDGRRVDVQLKGSGRTPFSRRGDGRAALDSVLREYIVSEAMHALGVPTTRALAAVRTGDTVVRYRASPGGVLVRVAGSHLRVGTLEYLASRRDVDSLRTAVELALSRHHPDAMGSECPALALLEAVGRAQARLVARWMGVGFIHGVMNTDNTSLSGETLDYGPCAFMDVTHERTVFSRVDEGGRYAYGRQPDVALWNLARMAEVLLPLIHADTERSVREAEAVLERLVDTFEQERLRVMGAKLGLAEPAPEDGVLLADLLQHMQAQQLDFTTTFRQLARDLRQGRPPGGRLVGWVSRWRARLDRPAAAVADAMDRVNPAYIPRNHQVEAALEAAIHGDLGPTRALLDVLDDPFTEREGLQAYAAPPEDGGRGYWTHCNT